MRVHHKTTLIAASLLVVAMTSCSRSSPPVPNRPTYIEFRLALRDRPYQAGDSSHSGSFTQPYQTIHVPVRVPADAGASSAHHDGVWVDVRWDRIVEHRHSQTRESSLDLYGFAYRIRDGVVTESVTSGERWIGPNNTRLTTNWDHFLTPTSVAATADKPVMVQQWRWTDPPIRGPNIEERLALQGADH